MGIFARNREEWAITDLATMRQSGTTVALYDSLGPQAVEYVVKQTLLTTISCETRYLNMLINMKNQGRAPSLVNLVSFDHFEDEVRADAVSAGINLYHIKEVIDKGRESKASGSTSEIFEEPKPETIMMFCYTSGTTGNPKAAKLTHSNFIAVCTASKYAGFDLSPDDKMISYLPLAHSFEKLLFSVSIVRGTRIGYYCGDVLKLTDDC